MDKQITMSTLRDELLQVKTNKSEFLEQIERIIPWGAWQGIIKPHTIGKFRNLLIKHGIQEKLFAQVLEILQKKGLILKKGTI
jgi:hypothetical protein